MRRFLAINLFAILIVLNQIYCQTNGPQLPVSVLDEILRANTTGSINSNDPLGMILGALMPMLGSNSNSGGDNSGSGSDNSTGVGVLDFFRNIVAMFLRAVLQVFKFFQLLSRAITGDNKLAFLSTEQITNQLSDNENSDKSQEKLVSVLRQLQESADEFPLNYFISDEKAVELENQIKDVFKQLPNFENKSYKEILKSDSFKANFKSGLKSLNRNKRQDFNGFNELNLPLNELLNQFYKSHSNLNNEFEFEFSKTDE